MDQMLRTPPNAAQLDAIRNGDLEERRRLLQDWAPVVLRWAARLGGSSVDPDDVAHDVLVSVLVHIGELRIAEAFPAWLYRTTVREVGRHRRMAWLRAWLPEAIGQVLSPTDSPEHWVERSEIGRHVQDILDSMPFHLKEVLVLCDLEDRTDEEVATLLSIPAGTVKSRLRKARERFARGVRRKGLALPEDDAVVRLKVRP